VIEAVCCVAFGAVGAVPAHAARQAIETPTVACQPTCFNRTTLMLCLPLSEQTAATYTPYTPLGQAAGFVARWLRLGELFVDECQKRPQLWKCFHTNARPEPDFRYLSNFAASCSVRNSRTTEIRQGRFARSVTGRTSQRVKGASSNEIAHTNDRSC
jgi:hypothetical protein